MHIGKLIFYGRMYLHTFFVKWFFNKFGRNSLVDVAMYITPKYINIGNHVHIYINARIEGVNRYNNQLFNPLITIEDNVGIEQNVHITCAQSITIKTNVAIANNVTITDIDHPYTNIFIPIEKQDIITKPVVIGEGCKVFSNAVILQGTTLGRHTVVAANSTVLAGEYPDYCVLAGSPAKIVKQYNINSKTWESPNSNK